jgi:hypothetical protein
LTTALRGTPRPGDSGFVEFSRLKNRIVRATEAARSSVLSGSLSRMRMARWAISAVSWRACALLLDFWNALVRAVEPEYRLGGEGGPAALIELSLEAHQRATYSCRSMKDA